MKRIAKDGGPGGFTSGDPFDVEENRNYGPEDKLVPYRMRGRDKASDADSEDGGPVSVEWADVGEMIGASIERYTPAVAAAGHIAAHTLYAKKSSPEKWHFEAKDTDGQLSELLDHISDTAATGHSFNVVTDPDDSEYKKEFFIDGDGGVFLDRVEGVKTTEPGDLPMDQYEFMGFPIVVENSKGSYRTWHDKENNETGKTKMNFDYGYIDGAIGADGDEVDVYIGPKKDADMVYVIHQMKTPDFVTYDEDKVMLGFDREEDARKAYLKQYNDERFYGGMSSMPVESFRKSIQSGQEGKKITNRKRANAMAEQNDALFESAFGPSEPSLVNDMDELDTALKSKDLTTAKKVYAKILATDYSPSETIEHEARVLYLFAEMENNLSKGNSVCVQDTGREGKVSAAEQGVNVVEFSDGLAPETQSYLDEELKKASKAPKGLRVIAALLRKEAESERTPHQIPENVIHDVTNELAHKAHDRELSLDEESTFNILENEEEKRKMDNGAEKLAGLLDFIDGPEAHVDSDAQEEEVDFFDEPSEEGVANNISTMSVARLTESRPRLLAGKSKLISDAADTFKKAIASLKAPLSIDNVSLQRIDTDVVGEDGTLVKGAVHFQVILASRIHRRRASMEMVISVYGGVPIDNPELVSSGGERLPCTLASVDKLMNIRRENTRGPSRISRVPNSYHKE